MGSEKRLRADAVFSEESFRCREIFGSAKKPQCTATCAGSILEFLGRVICFKLSYLPIKN